MPEFLTCYDYGTGGVWLYLEAASPAEIKAAYPELTVYETLPAWWNEENETLTRAQNFRKIGYQNSTNSRRTKNTGNRMQMLIEVIHDLLTVLLVVGIGTVIFVWCAAVRLQTRVAWQWMDDPNHSWSRGGLALFPGVSWPEKYQKQRRQLVTMYIGFFAGSAVCTLLMFLVNATAKTYPAC